MHYMHSYVIKKSYGWLALIKKYVSHYLGTDWIYCLMQRLQLRFDFCSTLFQLRFKCATTIRQHTSMPTCVWAAALRPK